jgi:hypothetical protein
MVAGVVVAALGVSAPAHAASAFAGLSGSWSGSGQVRLESGQREAIRCSASYVPRDGGTAMGLSLRCASASNRIELRASLLARGDRVSGTWEERSFGLSGGLSGVASGNTLRLLFSGSLSGAMLVTTSGNSQSISVRTDTSALQGVNVSLRRN